MVLQQAQSLLMVLQFAPPAPKVVVNFAHNVRKYCRSRDRTFRAIANGHRL
jgi:hypothetical protein